MKKLLVVSAILIGAATASPAAIRLNFGLGFPVPIPRNLMVGTADCDPGLFVAPAPVCNAPAVVEAPFCDSAPVFVERGPGHHGYDFWRYDRHDGYTRNGERHERGDWHEGRSTHRDHRR